MGWRTGSPRGWPKAGPTPKRCARRPRRRLVLPGRVVRGQHQADHHRHDHHHRRRGRKQDPLPLAAPSPGPPVRARRRRASAAGKATSGRRGRPVRPARQAAARPRVPRVTESLAPGSPKPTVPESPEPTAPGSPELPGPVLSSAAGSQRRVFHGVTRDRQRPGRWLARRLTREPGRHSRPGPAPTAAPAPAPTAPARLRPPGLNYLVFPAGLSRTTRSLSRRNRLAFPAGLRFRSHIAISCRSRSRRTRSRRLVYPRWPQASLAR